MNAQKVIDASIDLHKIRSVVLELVEKRNALSNKLVSAMYRVTLEGRDATPEEKKYFSSLRSEGSRLYAAILKAEEGRVAAEQRHAEATAQYIAIEKGE